MTTTALLRTPAGWYPDPLGSSADERRWWNGEMWTEYTAPVATLTTTTTIVTSTGPVTLQGAASKPTARESARIAQAMPLHTTDRASTDLTPTSEKAPAVSTAARRGRRGRLSTGIPLAALGVGAGLAAWCTSPAGTSAITVLVP